MKLTARKKSIVGHPLAWCGARLLVCDDPDDADPTFSLVDLRGKRRPLPKRTTPTLARDDRRMFLDVDGKDVGGVWTWAIKRWDLANRLTPFATCTPDDNLGHLELVGDRIVGVAKHKRGHSIVELDDKGTRVREVNVGTLVPFRVAADATHAVWFYFTGKGGVVDLATGKHAPLVGGAVRIGRQHDKGIGDVALAGDFVLATFRTKTARVWRVSTNKLVHGPWEREEIDNACWIGDRVCWWSGSTFASSGVSGDVTRRAALPGRVASLGDRAHVVCYADRTLEIWNLDKRVAKFKAPATLRGFAASPTHLAIGLETGRTIILERRA